MILNTTVFIICRSFPFLYYWLVLRRFQVYRLHILSCFIIIVVLYIILQAHFQDQYHGLPGAVELDGHI